MLFRVRGEILDAEDLESEILKRIFDALDVPYSGCYKVLDPVIRIIDDNLLKTESAQLMAKHGGGIFPGMNLPGLVIKPWDWHVAQAAFLRAYEDYRGEV
jgi:hypothetical protein